MLFTVLEMTSRMYAVNDEIEQVYENIKQRRKDRTVTEIKDIIQGHMDKDGSERQEHSDGQGKPISNRKATNSPVRKKKQVNNNRYK